LHYPTTALAATQQSFCKLPPGAAAADAFSNVSNAYAMMPFLLPLASFAPRPK
jgi:Na+/phosphate symporter